MIVGSGPAGLAAAAQAAARGMSYVVLERTDHLADTIHCYQKRKHVMAEPGMIPQRGEIPFAAAHVILSGLVQRFEDLREGMTVGFDVGWTSKGLRVTVLHTAA